MASCLPTLPGIFFRLGYLLLTTLFLAACGTSIKAVHNPLYRASTHASTITATASNSSAGIKKIGIIVTTGTMTDCTELGGPASAIPCRLNATTVTHTCNYAGSPSTATCTYSQTLNNQAIVTYHAETEPVTGSSRSTEEITYAGGFPPVAGIARPVWWHRDPPDPPRYIDIGFFPDADYVGDYLDFTGDLEAIATGVFFNIGQNFAQDYTIFRGNVNLWAAPFGADAEQSCTFSFNPLVTPIRANMDGQAIVHTANFRDCAFITLGGTGSVWANAGNPAQRFVHESGHFLHGQGDEYCCDGGYATAGTCKNVFSSEAACQSAAPGADANPSDCVEIASGATMTGAWRNDDGRLETMADQGVNADFHNNSSLCVVQRFLSCGSGSCY